MASNTQESRIFSRFGTATVSLGAPAQHDLSKKLKAAARAGFKYIDLFDECWAFYLKSHGQNETKLWDATPINLSLARNLGEEVKSLGMQIVCTQPLRVIEGRRDPGERKKLLELVAKRFPFMRAFDTDLVFMCSSLDKEPSSTLDYKTVAKDLAEMGRMAEEFSVADGGRMLKIGYENLSWAQRNTWASTWEVVHAANRHNVGLIVDSFNLLAVEFADPYNPEGHGRIYSTLRESLDVLRMSLASLVATVPGERIFLVQLCPLETERGGYMPVDLVVATILATGYRHAERAIKSLKKLCEAATRVDPFWSTKASDSPAYKLWKQGKTSLSSTTSSRI
ncbi:xylose isomerase-like protein [Dactylonectria estremocensis]|uniref:Xylose isomerase-like protein n=1 Tax=Dactylonectria estremocensis TaxID=1079267 RepID=A0A9P9D5K4_9HYPO|nr:xylose isomerase-like protein [Dactylonectria estremocensis]